jgi:protein CpxP
MKKRLLILLALVMGATTFAVAQGGGGGFQRRTPEERTAAIHQKLDSAFKLDAKTFATLDTALNALNRQQDKKMQELMAGGPGSVDRETMRAEREKFETARDEMIKAVLTEDQFKIWKEQIAPSMRPRGFGGGGNRNNNK